jgi:tetratricopeptide (TPR) repeat protein
MGFRFRKTIKMGPVNLNISKSGVGTSIGGKGLRVGVNAKGKGYTSASIPGTGIRYTSYSKSSSKARGTQVTSTNYKKVSYYNPDNLSSKYFELPIEYTQISGQNGCLMLSVWAIAIVLCFSYTPVGLVSVIGLCIYQYTVSKKPENKRNAALRAAQILFSKGMYNEAIFKLMPINNSMPNDFAVSHLLGLCNYNTSNFKSAIPYFENGLNSNPSDYRTTLFLAHSCSALDTEETNNKAVVHYERFLEQNSSNDDFKFLIANALFKVEDYESALSYLQGIPENSEHYLKALNAISACFVKRNQLDLAIDTLKRAPLLKRNLDDDLKAIHYSLAMIYLEQDDKQQANKHLNRIYSQDVGYKDVSDKIRTLGI